MSKQKKIDKIVPKCVVGDRVTMGHSALGFLLPCCWCDQEWTLNTPLFQKMLKVSKVSDVENIDEIVF